MPDILPGDISRLAGKVGHLKRKYAFQDNTASESEKGHSYLEYLFQGDSEEVNQEEMLVLTRMIRVPYGLFSLGLHSSSVIVNTYIRKVKGCYVHTWTIIIELT